MPYPYLIIGACLLFTGIGIFLIQAYFWLVHQEWMPAPLSLFWELVGIAGPLGDLPMFAVFVLFGIGFVLEGLRQSDRGR